MKSTTQSLQMTILRRAGPIVFVFFILKESFKNLQKSSTLVIQTFRMIFLKDLQVCNL